MKNFLYQSIKIFIKAGLHCYYGKISVVGSENIPRDKPVLFLPNHQNALMDVLLLVTDCNRKPYFLTRSDIFGKPILNTVFDFFRMIPIYRLRDGREALAKNDAIFLRCADILGRGEALSLFPEANHNLKRTVRPLSKGFTRILNGALEKYPDLDIQLVPVGFNYKDAKSFPDAVSIHYGKAISFKSIPTGNMGNASTPTILKKVEESLRTLTTHIPPEADYENIDALLHQRDANFLHPKETNTAIQQLLQKSSLETLAPVKRKKPTLILRLLFKVLNFPVLFIWKFVVKPKIWEQEFIATMRFATALIGFFIYYALLFLIMALLLHSVAALMAIVGIFMFNWIAVKTMAIASE